MPKRPGCEPGNLAPIIAAANEDRIPVPGLGLEAFDLTG